MEVESNYARIFNYATNTKNEDKAIYDDKYFKSFINQVVNDLLDNGVCYCYSEEHVKEVKKILSSINIKHEEIYNKGSIYPYYKLTDEDVSQ